jgi:thioredoxin-related protein
MAALVYTAAPVVDAAAGVIAVEIDGDESRELVKSYGVQGYPTLILLDGSGREIRRAVGYQGVAAMVEFFRR